MSRKKFNWKSLKNAAKDIAKAACNEMLPEDVKIEEPVQENPEQKPLQKNSTVLWTREAVKKLLDVDPVKDAFVFIKFEPSMGDFNLITGTISINQLLITRELLTQRINVAMTQKVEISRPKIVENVDEDVLKNEKNE